MSQLAWTKLVIVLGLFWCQSRVRRAWRGPRSCPTVPLSAKLPRFAYEAELYPLLFATLTVVGVSHQPVFSILAWVVLVALSCLYDYSRLLPWFYQYSFMLGSIALCNLSGAGPRQQQEALDICRLINISIYFWSGLLKANRYFIQSGFLALVTPLLKNLGPGWRPFFQFSAVLVPFWEAGVGLGLLFPQTRLAAILAAAVMHGFILLCFSSLGRGTHRTIWPWNITMLATTVVLFSPAGGPKDILIGQGSLFHWLVLLLFACLPMLGLFNRIDCIFSHAYMTGRHILGYLHIHQRLYDKLPSEIQAECADLGRGQARRYLLDLGSWYVKQLGMNPPQNEKMLQHVARDFRRYGAGFDDLSLTITLMPGLFSASLPHKTYSWVALFGPEQPAEGVRSRSRKLKARDLRRT
ncbi:MAG: hypothetical protein KF760_23580 [Candidatus Eremiobacteraeota bacterium]|nr:hypothetical protein [Candidatus Eremiobacteraeota bacterium]MCW5866206.1 hypothetical protein [Candidatus Eremiobacteraeota bacterium]